MEGALKPTVSIIMPTYNQAKFLEAALDSITAQTFRDYELIVVNDGSADATAEILRSRFGPYETPPARPYGISRVVTNLVNTGTACAINTGEAVAKGRYLTWVSSDNVMDRDWLKLLAAVLDSGAGAAYGGFRWIPPSGAARYLFSRHERDKLLKQEECYYGPAFLIRADVWRRAGPHRGFISHDYDHWTRVEEECWRQGRPIVGVDRSLCDYSAHGERVTITRRHQYDAPHWQKVARWRREVGEERG